MSNKYVVVQHKPKWILKITKQNAKLVVYWFNIPSSFFEWTFENPFVNNTKLSTEQVTKTNKRFRVQTFIALSTM